MDLYYNNLTEHIPSEIGNLTNLVYLNLSNNQLSGSIPSSIGNLINLIDLYSQNNQLSGEIPQEVCDLISNTSNINISHIIGGNNLIVNTCP